MTGVQLIQEFFAPPKVEMAELKALKSEERNELAAAIAAQRGLTKKVIEVAGKPAVVTYE